MLFVACACCCNFPLQNKCAFNERWEHSPKEPLIGAWIRSADSPRLVGQPSSVKRDIEAAKGMRTVQKAVGLFVGFEPEEAGVSWWVGPVMMMS